MKNSIVFLMAVLVLGFSFMPCTDIGAEPVAAAVVNMADMPGESHDDDCSPFCSCTCCAGFSVNWSSNSAASVLPYASAFLPVFANDEVIEISLPVWQPPQL